MAHLSLRFLGPPHIELGGSAITLPTRKAIALLAYLATTERPHPREHLATLLWPCSDQQHARGALRYTLAALRQSLGDQWVTADRISIGLQPAHDIQTDVSMLRKAATTQPTPETLAAVAALYRGPFLSELILDESEEFTHWQHIEAERAQQHMTKVLEQLIAIHQHAGAFETAIGYAQQWLRMDMRREPAHYRLIELYAMAGQRSEALRQYELCAQHLDELWGISPSEEMQALHRQILQGQPAPASPQRAAAHGLPAQTTSFISREAELQQILGHLAHPQHRLVTLTGPGGIGKTRLAIQSAYRATEQAMFQDGIFFVDLAGLDSGSFLAATIATAIGCTTHGVEFIAQQLTDHLARRKILLLLDNFEHLIDTGIDMLDTILHSAPYVHLLITSRESLDMVEEWLIDVRGLSFPASDDADGGDYDAVRMFIDRAQQVCPGFCPSAGSEDQQAMYQICRLVEGMPLGIELAATWVRLLPCAQIAHELQSNFDFLSKAQRNRPQRHSGLRAMFDYSWQMLQREHQQALAQLAVFRGSFTKEAVIDITQADLASLSVLMDKSLLRRHSGEFYSIHELLRQFAFEQLQADAALAQRIRDRHAAYFGALVAQQATRWDSEEMAEACQTIQSVIDNVRDGWMWASSHQNLTTIQLYLDSLFDFYIATSWYQEGKDLFAYAIAAISGGQQPEQGFVLAQLYTRHARFCQDLGLFDQAQRSREQSMAWLQQFPDANELAFVYEQAGLASYYQGDAGSAIDLLRISLSHAQQTNDAARKAHILISYAAVLIKLGAYEAAEHTLDESHAIYQRIQKRWGIAYCMRFLGICAQERGDLPKAQALHQHSLVLFQEIELPTGIAVALASLGEIGVRQRHYEDAYRSYRQALGFARDTHSMPIVLQVLLGFVQMLVDPSGVEIWPQAAPHSLVLLAFITQNPAASCELRDTARALFVEHAAALPPDQITLLHQQAKVLDLAQVSDHVAQLAPQNNPKIMLFS